MNPRAVQSERERNTAQPEDVGMSDEEEQSLLCNVEVQTDATTNCKFDPLPSPEVELTRVAEQVVGMHRKVCQRVDASLHDGFKHTLDGQPTASVTFVRAFYDPTLISPRTPLLVTGDTVATMKDVMQDWRRNFVLFADWLHALPEFNALNMNDQLLIAKNRFGPFYWWMCACWSVATNSDGVCYANGTFFPQRTEQQCVPDVRGCSQKMMRSLVDPLKLLMLDETERVLVLAILVFSEEMSEMSPSGKWHVRQCNSRFLCAMQHHIRSKDASMSHQYVSTRIGKVMLLLSATTNLVYLTNDNITLNDILHVIDLNFCNEIFTHSYKNF